MRHLREAGLNPDANRETMTPIRALQRAGDVRRRWRGCSRGRRAQEGIVMVTPTTPTPDRADLRGRR